MDTPTSTSNSCPFSLLCTEMASKMPTIRPRRVFSIGFADRSRKRSLMRPFLNTCTEMTGLQGGNVALCMLHVHFGASLGARPAPVVGSPFDSRVVHARGRFICGVHAVALTEGPPMGAFGARALKRLGDTVGTLHLHRRGRFVYSVHTDALTEGPSMGALAFGARALK